MSDERQYGQAGSNGMAGGEGMAAMHQGMGGQGGGAPGMGQGGMPGGGYGGYPQAPHPQQWGAPPPPAYHHGYAPPPQQSHGGYAPPSRHGHSPDYRGAPQGGYGGQYAPHYGAGGVGGGMGNALTGFLDFRDERFLKGLLVGAAVTFLATNEGVQKSAFRTVARVWGMFQGGMEEMKERFHDAEAELKSEHAPAGSSGGAA